MKMISAKGYYQDYDDIEIKVEDLDECQLEWIVNEARKKKLVPQPRTHDQEFIEEALSLIWQKDLIGLERLVTRQLPSEVCSVEDIREKYELLMRTRQAA